MAKTHLSSKEQEQLELGKKLQTFYEQGYVNKKATLLFSLLKGIAAGIGGVVGATLVLALLIWILSLFSEAPLVGPFVDTVKNTIEQRGR